MSSLEPGFDLSKAFLSVFLIFPSEKKGLDFLFVEPTAAELEMMAFFI